jgi:hypothetical protein
MVMVMITAAAEMKYSELANLIEDQIVNHPEND